MAVVMNCLFYKNTSPDPLYLPSVKKTSLTYVKWSPAHGETEQEKQQHGQRILSAHAWSSQNMFPLYWRLGKTDKLFSVLYKNINTLTTLTYIVSPPLKAVKEAGSIRTEKRKDASFLPARLERNLAKPYQLLPVCRNSNHRVPPPFSLCLPFFMA